GARAEVGARAAQHQHAQGLVVRRVLQGVVELVQHLLGDAVAGFGAVQRDRRPGTEGFVSDRLVGHLASLPGGRRSALAASDFRAGPAARKRLFETFRRNAMAAANGRKSIFITGAASGMGRETAKLFAAEGWFVGAYDVNAAGLESLMGEVGGPNGLFQSLD